MVTSYIISSMTSEICDDFNYVESAFELWNDVKERFGQTNGPMIFQLKKEIACLK